MMKIDIKPAYLLPSLLSFLMFFFSTAAQAELWGYIDEKGVAHLAAERLDARYEMFYRGNDSSDSKTGFDSDKDLDSKGGVMSRSASLAKSNSKIQTYFEISPNVKSVKHHLRDASRTHQVDFELLQALIAAESGFDPQAVSPKGAVGLMQLMPDTAKRFGVQADKQKTVVQKLTDPKININAGAKYLRVLLQMFPGNLELVLAAYNAGEGAVVKYGNKIPPYKETQNYVKTVMQTYTALKPPLFLAALTQSDSTRTTPTRVKMEIGGATVGGAVGRGNMMAPLQIYSNQAAGTSLN